MAARLLLCRETTVCPRSCQYALQTSRQSTPRHRVREAGLQWLHVLATTRGDAECLFRDADGGTSSSSGTMFQLTYPRAG